MIRTLTLLAASATLSLGLVSVATAAEAAPAKTYSNCTKLNKDYKHGVGRSGAKDKTSGTPVKTFTRNTKVYQLNKKSDRDKDGIACEKK
ncbi:MAG: calcium-binding protein [Aeromicrobium sp.]|jgi:hypothetical protein|nr:calcium-binding protein [Aeromicrobium sp.]